MAGDRIHVVSDRSTKEGAKLSLERTIAPPSSRSMRYANPADEETVGSVDSSRSRKSEMVSRTAVAACSSRTGSPVAIERFVKRNERTSVTDSCAAVDRDHAST